MGTMRGPKNIKKSKQFFSFDEELSKAKGVICSKSPMNFCLFGGAGAHHVGSQRVNSNRGCVTEVGLRDY